MFAAANRALVVFVLFVAETTVTSATAPLIMMQAKVRARVSELEHELEHQEMEMVKQAAAATAAGKKTLKQGFEQRKKMLEEGIEREKRKMQRELKEKHEEAIKEVALKAVGVEQSILRRKKETERKARHHHSQHGPLPPNPPYQCSPPNSHSASPSLGADTKSHHRSAPLLLVQVLAMSKEVDDEVEEKELVWRKKALTWLNKAHRKFQSRAKARSILALYF